MEAYYSKKDLINAKNNDTNYIYDLTDLEEFLEYVPTADVVPKDEVVKIFEEIESVLFIVADPCPSADGTMIIEHSKDFHLRREDYYTIKEKYTKGGRVE